MALVGSMLVGALVVAGCGGSDSSDDNADAGKGKGAVPEPTSPVTVTFSSWVGTQPAMKKLAENFHAEHPNISIEFQNVTADNSQQKITTQIAGGNPPDAAFVDAGAVPTFAGRDAIVNLDNYISRSAWVKPDAYVPAFKDFVTIDKSMYGLPFEGESTSMFYNKDMFEAAGIDHPPTTWEEMEADAAALTDPDQKQYGIELFASESAYYWYPFLYQAGGEQLSPDGKEVAFNSPEGKQAAEFYVGLTKYAPAQYLNSNSYDGRIAFEHGQVGMYMAGNWLAATLEDDAPEFMGHWATAPLPKGPAGCATTVAGDALVLFHTDHNDAAWKWIEYLSKPEIIAQWTYKGVPGVEGVASGTELPTLTSQLSDPALYHAKPILSGFAKDMKDCGIPTGAPNARYGEVEAELNTELGKAMYGDQSASEALDNAADKAEEIFAR
jgi:ABC-type glycerol-3-phosphate transport system substrate-binding protein